MMDVVGLLQGVGGGCSLESPADAIWGRACCSVVGCSNFSEKKKTFGHGHGTRPRARKDRFYGFLYKINDFLYLLAQVDQTPLFVAHALAQGKDGISGFLYKNIGFLYFGYICSILFIYFSVLVILLSYKWWDGRAPNQGFRVTPTNGIETIYGKAW